MSALTDPSLSTKSSRAAVADEAMSCPGCGYDLRAATTDVCSECGMKVDPAILRQSGFPWAHRKRIGRIKAYLLTVWLITIGSRKLAYEASRPQDPRDGRRFMWVTGILVAIYSVGAFLVALGGPKDAREALAYVPDYQQVLIVTLPVIPKQPPGLKWDVAVAWSAGSTLWPTWGCIVLLAFSFTRLPRAVIRAPRDDAGHSRVQAIACYLSAPLAFLWLSPLLWALSLCLGLLDTDRDLRSARAILISFAAVWPAIVLVIELAQCGRWMARATNCGFFRGLLAALELAGLWLIGAVVLLGLMPWCVGMLWIVIDSLR